MTATTPGTTGGQAQIAGERRPYPTKRLSDGQPRAIMFDSNTCIGCRQCVEACKDWNELPRGNTYRINPSTWLTMEPPVLEGTAEIWGRNSCMHCEYPVCASVCPVEAITKYEEGPVVIDQSVCIGCEYCIYACPWHVISKSDVTGKATKCTMCVDRVSEAKQPFCVQACPVGALAFGTVDEIETTVAERAEAANADRGGVSTFEGVPDGEEAAPSPQPSPPVGERELVGGITVYGRREAGGTHVLHVLLKSPEEHGLPEVSAERYPAHHIPLGKEIKGVLTLTGGVSGKLRAVSNAVTKPWRLKYRYWPKPEQP